MKNILILYATREGQTEKVAAQISTHLKKAGANVELINAQDKTATEDIDLDVFDLLVFGASMHAGGLEQELVDFINSHKEQIEQRVRSFFLVLLSAATKDSKLRAEWLKDARNKMDEQIQVQFQDVEMIAGALMYSKYSLPLKWIMKRIAKQAGEGTDTSKDYEYTDWQQVEQYSENLMNISKKPKS
ncbi:MAG: flavodoxin domain-containing protein, partial [Waterburya sp.]